MGLIRFILALSVILWHTRSEKMILHGGIAVLIFYIISGFYMTMVLNEKYLPVPQHGIKAFFFNRILRLYPIYLIWLCMLSCWTLITNQANIFAVSLDLSLFARFSLVFSNISFLGLDFFKGVLAHENAAGTDSLVSMARNIFGAGAFNQNYIVIGPAWSVGVEILFYMAAPFIVISFRRVLLFIALSLAIRVWFFTAGDAFPNDPWRYRFLPSVLVFFLMGSGSYYLYRLIKPKQIIDKLGLIVLILVCIFIIAITIASPGLFVIQGQQDSQSNFDGITLWIFYIASSLAIPFIFNSTQNSDLDNFIGKLSYPMYIIHYGLINNILRYLGYRECLAFTFFVILITVTLSIVFVLFIDKPIDKYKQRIINTIDSDRQTTIHFISFLITMFAVPIALLSLFSIIRGAF